MQIVKAFIVIWRHNEFVEFYHVDRLVKVYEVRFTFVPNMIRVTPNLNELILLFKYSVVTKLGHLCA